MKNTRYVKVTASFVLCYDEPLDAVPEEVSANAEKFILSGVEGAFIAKNRPNRQVIYICPFSAVAATLIHAPRSQPRVMAQVAEGAYTFLTRKQSLAREKAQLASVQEAEAAKVPKKAGRGKKVTS